MLFLSETTTHAVVPSDMAQPHVAWELSRFSVGSDCRRRGAGPWILRFGLEQSQKGVENGVGIWGSIVLMLSIGICI